MIISQSKGKKSGRILSRAADDSGAPSEIVIDEAKKLVFVGEDELFSHFAADIKTLEDEYFSMRGSDDFGEDEQESMEHYLELTLEDPDEVWQDSSTLGEDAPLCHFLRKIYDDLFYVASTYVTDDTPTFVYLHFATRSEELLENYKRGELIYDETMRDLDLVALEGDALEENDAFAIGLFQAMMTLRTENDIPMEDFKNFAHLREITIEAADEIWRTTDTLGNGLVTFIRECPDQGIQDLHYIAITQEDEPAGVHELLFSFPTTDRSLVGRYAQGENLQAEEVTQESRH